MITLKDYPIRVLDSLHDFFSWRSRVQKYCHKEYRDSMISEKEIRPGASR